MFQSVGANVTLVDLTSSKRPTFTVFPTEGATIKRYTAIIAKICRTTDGASKELAKGCSFHGDETFPLVTLSYSV